MYAQTKLMPSTQKGVALIEVLVAILLLTIGLLAMAGLTVSATAHNKMSQIRGVGTMLVNDYAERARANLHGFDRGGYEIKNGLSYTLPTSGPSLPGLSPANNNAAADAMATYDQEDWVLEVSRRLPRGRVYVETAAPAPGDAGGLRTMNVWINWLEQESSVELFNAAPSGCPSGVTEITGSKCMFFKVAI